MSSSSSDKGTTIVTARSTAEERMEDAIEVAGATCHQDNITVQDSNTVLLEEALPTSVHDHSNGIEVSERRGILEAENEGEYVVVAAATEASDALVSGDEETTTTSATPADGLLLPEGAVVVIDGISYPINTLLNTAGKRNAVHALKKGENDDDDELKTLKICENHHSISYWGAGCGEGTDCPYIHLVANHPTKAHAQYNTTVFKSEVPSPKVVDIGDSNNDNNNIDEYVDDGGGYELYYQRERLYVVSDPLHLGRAKHLCELNATLAELHHRERSVLLARQHDDDDPGDDSGDEQLQSAAPLAVVADNDDDGVMNDDAVVAPSIVAGDNAVVDKEEPSSVTRIIVAIDPIGTQLRDDAISCEFVELASLSSSVSKTVIAVTSYTPNFVDTGIASGHLKSVTLDRAYCLYEPHYIHRPEKLWGRWSHHISLSTTKTVSAIAATRYYDVLIGSDDQAIRVLGVSDQQPDHPLRIEDVRLTNIIDYDAANRMIVSSRIGTTPHFNIPPVHNNNQLGRTLALLGAVSEWSARCQDDIVGVTMPSPLMPSAGVTSEVTSEFDYDNPNYPKISISYRGSGDLDQDSLAHGVVGAALKQMKEMCYTAVDKTRAFRTSRRQYPSKSQLIKVCRSTSIPLSTNYYEVYDSLCAQGFNATAVELFIGCDVSDHLVVISEKVHLVPDRDDHKTLACTKPLRSFLSCYHQFLVLDAIDPISNAAKHRSALLSSLPPTTKLLKDFNLKRDSLRSAMFHRRIETIRHLAQVAPHVQVPVDAIVFRCPDDEGNHMKVYIPQLTAPPLNIAPPYVIELSVPVVPEGTYVMGHAVTLLLPILRLANPLDESAGVCTVVSEIPPALLPPCFRDDGVVVEGEGEEDTPGTEDTAPQQKAAVEEKERAVEVEKRQSSPSSVAFLKSYLTSGYMNADQDQEKDDDSSKSPSSSQVVDAPLPIETHMVDILDNIRNNRVMCLQGDTGCGKSTMLPLSLYRDAMKRGEKVTIIVTQPRRLAAQALAKHVASLLGEKVGHTVGYRMGGGTRVESKDTQIYYVTSGYISRNFVQGDLWGRATHIILDEVHERSLEADMMSLVIKLKLQADDEYNDQTYTTTPPANSKRLVVMSATIQSELFMKYFASLRWEGALMPPLMRVGGSRKYVAELFIPDIIKALSPTLSETSKSDLKKYADKLAKPMKGIRVHEKEVLSICDVINACVKKGSCILVFLPGLKLIEDIAKALRSQPSFSTMKLHILHSSVDPDEQNKVLIPATMDECKVVLSTNIAETSITIPDVKIVVDLGLALRVEYDKTIDLQRYECGWCSKAAARQRAGRAGRVSTGAVLRMYTDKIMKKSMKDFDRCELHPLESSALQMRGSLNSFGDVEELMQQLVEPPPRKDVATAMARLVVWGALGPAPDYEILQLGHLASSLSIGVRLTKAIMSAARFGCATDMAVIACGLQLSGSLIIHPMRTHYSSDYEFQQNVMKSWYTIHHFDRHRVSDLHSFLSIVEERCQDPTYGFFRKLSISVKKLQTLMWTSRQLCDQLQVQCKLGLIDLTTQDKRHMSIVMRGISGKSANSKLKFPSLHDPLRDELFQITLGQVADRMFASKSTSTSSVFLQSTSKIPAISSSSQTVVFSPVSDEVTDLPPSVLRSTFDVFGGAKVCNVQMVGNGGVVDGGLSKIVVELNTVGPTTTTSNNNYLPFDPTSPSHHPMSLPPGVAALSRLSRLTKSTCIANKNKDDDEGTTLSTPITAAKINGFRVVASTGGDGGGSSKSNIHSGTVIQPDPRWSVVGLHMSRSSPSELLRIQPMTGLAFGVKSLEGGKLIAAHALMLSCNMKGLPLISVMVGGGDGTIHPTAISVNITHFKFQPQTSTAAKKKNKEKSVVAAAPLPVILMANVLQLLQHSPLVTSSSSSSLLATYNKLRSIVNTMDTLVSAEVVGKGFPPVSVDEKQSQGCVKEEEEDGDDGDSTTGPTTTTTAMRLADGITSSRISMMLTTTTVYHRKPSLSPSEEEENTDGRECHRDTSNLIPQQQQQQQHEDGDDVTTTLLQPSHTTIYDVRSLSDYLTTSNNKKLNGDVNDDDHTVYNLWCEALAVYGDLMEGFVLGPQSDVIIIEECNDDDDDSTTLSSSSSSPPPSLQHIVGAVTGLTSATASFLIRGVHVLHHRAVTYLQSTITNVLSRWMQPSWRRAPSPSVLKSVGDGDNDAKSSELHDPQPLSSSSSENPQHEAIPMKTSSTEEGMVSPLSHVDHRPHHITTTTTTSSTVCCSPPAPIDDDVDTAATVSIRSVSEAIQQHEPSSFRHLSKPIVEQQMNRRCTGLSNRGNPCKKSLLPGRLLCRQHDPISRCVRTIGNRKCKKFALAGTRLCKKHTTSTTPLPSTIITTTPVAVVDEDDDVDSEDMPLVDRTNTHHHNSPAPPYNQQPSHPDADAQGEVLESSIGVEDNASIVFDHTNATDCAAQSVVEADNGEVEELLHMIVVEGEEDVSPPPPISTAVSSTSSLLFE